MKALFVAALVTTLMSPAFASQPSQAPVVVAQAQTGLIDINRATPKELATLKGIGEARAKAIIKERPYARKDDLVKNKIVPESVYKDIKDKIIAKQ